MYAYHCSTVNSLCVEFWSVPDQLPLSVHREDIIIVNTIHVHPASEHLNILSKY